MLLHKIIILVYICFFTFCNYSLCQTEIDKPVIFVSQLEDNKRIKNIETVTDEDLLSAEKVVYNDYNYANTQLNGDTLIANFDYNIDSISVGFSIYLKLIDSTNYSFTHLKINNLNLKLINFNNDIIKNSYRNNEIVNFIYDGNEFQIIKHKKKKCPNGFVEVNQYYCISEQIAGPGNFNESVLHCDTLKSRLCTWSEWYYACTSLNISDITSGHQWVDTGAVISDGAKVVGSGSCISNGATSSFNNSFFFRCCYTK